MIRVDVLAAKRNELDGYKKKSSAVLSMIKNMLNDLKDVNTKIETTISEILDYEEGLANTRAELHKEVMDNNSVIKKFESLVSGE